MADLSFQHFDCRIFEAMKRAPSDPDEAARLLTLAAEYLRKREPIPHDLADFMADAFESAAAKPSKDRARWLGHELHLTAQNRRPVRADWFEIGQAFEMLRDEVESDNKAIECIAADYGISKSTAAKLCTVYQLAVEEHDRVMRGEYPDMD